MEIQELFIKHYGKFENHRIKLKPGINIIYGGNETGKTTIHSFIRAMLFGLERSRGKAAYTDEYQIRQPWDTPGAFNGSMRVEKDGEIYRIDRNFDRNQRLLQIVNETTGEVYPDAKEALNHLTGGLSENAFLNTVFIPQAQAETDAALAKELRHYIVNSDQSLDARLDVGQALESLRKKKKQYEQQKKKEEAAMEAQIAKKQSVADGIRKELELLNQQAVLYNPVLQKQDSRYLQKGKSELSGEYEVDYEGEIAEHNTGIGKIILEILMFLAAGGAFFGSWYMSDPLIKLYLGVFGTLFLLMIILVHFLVRSKKQEHKTEQQETVPSHPEHLFLLDRIQKKEAEYRALQDELEKLYSSHVRLDGCETEIAALNMAIDRICSLSANIYKQSGGRLNDRASEILGALTNGAYNRIHMDETSEVYIHTPSRVLKMHQMSGGAMQQIYFALRIAAGELLSEDTAFPLILDETFALYDDSRLEAALRWLKQSGRQVILFTCQRREREILRTIE